MDSRRLERILNEVKDTTGYSVCYLETISPLADVLPPVGQHIPSLEEGEEEMFGRQRGAHHQGYHHHLLQTMTRV